MFEKLQPQVPFDREIVVSHVLASREMELPVTLDAAQLSDQSNAETPVLVVCPGPSAREKVEGGKTRLQALIEEEGQKVILAGAAVRFLYDGTLTADQIDGVIFSNPESAFEAHILGSDQIQGVPFYVATHCKPEVFAALQENGADVRPWNVHVEGVTEQLFENETSIGSGYGAAVSGIALMSAMGHRNFKAVGWDGVPEYAIDLNATPDYQEDLEKRSSVVEIDGRQYRLYEDFGGDVPELIKFATTYPDCIDSLEIHGDGPAAAMLNAQNAPRSDFSKVALVADTADLGEPADRPIQNNE